MFGRVGGGIYTKAADVGADLVGKVSNDLNEGDVAGMGADLFGSFAESTCAALVIATVGVSAVVDDGTTYEPLLSYGWAAVMFPILVSASGIIVCLLCSFVATHISPVKSEGDVELVLKVRLIVTTLVMIPVSYGLAAGFLPDSFTIVSVVEDDGYK